MIAVGHENGAAVAKEAEKKRGKKHNKTLSTVIKREREEKTSRNALPLTTAVYNFKPVRREWEISLVALLF